MVYRILTVLFLFAALISACSGNVKETASQANRLIGKWQHIEPDGVTILLEFTVAEMRYTSYGVVAIPSASYTYVDDTTILVRNAGTDIAVKIPYSIKGNTLTIAFNQGDKVVFTRVK